MAAEANVKSGALLGFKVGLQSTVDSMLAQEQGAPQAEHGCFYLTKDAHRLYVGNEDGTLSAVNEGIEWIGTWTQLQTIASTAASSVSGARYLTGRFYYVVDRNVLCVYNGSNWVQLNENSNTTTVSNEYGVVTASDTSTITNTITDSTGATFADSFTVTGANGISITSSGKAITLTGDTYTLSSAQSGNDINLNLDSTGTNNDSSVKLKAGSNITLTKDANSNDVTIGARNTENSTAEFTAQSAGYKFTITDTQGAEVEATVDPKISVYTDSSPSGTTTNSVSFVSGTATLDVYSRSAIDAKLYAVNAMTYRGTVGPSGSGATSITYNKTTGETTIVKNGTAVPVSIGDTFLVTQEGNYNSQSYKENSLFIVRAKDGKSEGSDGIIAVGDFICDVVAEQWIGDTHYYLEDITNGVRLHESTGGTTGSLVITPGSNNDWIDVTESSTPSGDGVDKTLTITHKSITRNDTTVNATEQVDQGTVTIPGVTGVTTDSKGHVTGITTQNFILHDTNATIDSMSTATSAYSDTTNNYKAGVITITTTLAQSGGAAPSESTAVVLSSSSLSISDEDSRPTTLNGALTPGGLKIEMLWGSF